MYSILICWYKITNESFETTNYNCFNVIYLNPHQRNIIKYFCFCFGDPLLILVDPENNFNKHLLYILDCIEDSKC